MQCLSDKGTCIVCIGRQVQKVNISTLLRQREAVPWIIELMALSVELFLVFVIKPQIVIASQHYPYKCSCEQNGYMTGVEHIGSTLEGSV